MKTNHRFTLAQFHQWNEDNGGACIECGAEAEGVEPDARQYQCATCRQLAVYGAEELLLMGYVE